MTKVPDKTGLVKISELSRRSGVSSATIKYYIREGLLPEPPLRTSRNMAWYDPSMVPRIKAIKELQRTRFLPLKVIRKILDGVERAPSDEHVIKEVEQILRRSSPSATRNRRALEEDGVDPVDMDWLTRVGIVTPRTNEDGDEVFGAEDLALIKVLMRARAAGIRSDMLPPDILLPYVEAIRNLVHMELQMFRMGVLPRAEVDLPDIVEAATELSEQLVVLLRRKLLVPTLKSIVAEEKNASD
jgi:DNA-binding transcriptional MerR regulator